MPLPRDLPAALRSLADAGYSRIVLPPLDPAATDAVALARVLAEHAIAPITIAGGQAEGADVSSEDADERAAGAALLRSIVDLTEALGGDQMNGVPYGPFGPPARADLARGGRALGPRSRAPSPTMRTSAGSR